FMFTTPFSSNSHLLSLHDALPIFTAVLLDRFSSNQALTPTEGETEVDGLIDLAQGTPLSKTYHRLAKKEMGLEPDTVGWTKKRPDRKSTRLNSSHVSISYAVFCLK